MYTHIEGNIYSIFVPLPDNPLRNLNAYLIKDDKRSLLIDTGFRARRVPRSAARRARGAGRQHG